MARGRARDAETKAAVMSALLAGQSVEQVAEEYGLPIGTVKSWKRVAPTWDELVEPEKKDELGELIGRVITETLTTLAAQAELARDPDWVRKQAASELAVLYGVLADKSFRILTAIEQARPADDGQAT